MGRKPKAAWRCALCSTYASEATPRSKYKRALCEDCYDSLAPRGLAWCSKGGHRVRVTDMRQRWCRACHRTSQRERRTRCREAIEAHRKQRYHTDSDFRARRLQSGRAWRAKHGDTFNMERRIRRKQRLWGLA